MISLFLVEDEKFSRESIKNNIDWKSHGIKFLGEAPDGEIALPQVLELRPDVLLTDIRMPFMNGLELTQEVKRSLPETKIIILSGYDDFAYARQAINLGVNEYILKPASSEDLLHSVKKVQKDILKKRKQREDQLQKEKDHFHLKRYLFMHSLLHGFFPTGEEIDIKLAELGLPQEQNLVGLYYLQPETPLTLPHLTNLLETAFEECLVYPHKGKEVLCLLWIDEESQLAVKKEQILEQLGTLGCAGSIHIETDLIQCLSDAGAVFRKRESATDSFPETRSFSSEALSEFLAIGKESMTVSFWKQYEPVWKNSLKSTIFRCYLYTEIFYTLSRFCQQAGLPQHPELSGRQDLERLISNIRSSQEFFPYICRICSEIMIWRDQQGVSAYAPVERRVQEYLQNNYDCCDISLSTAASFVNMSPGYLSAIFKEKTGSNFSDCLSALRMEKAREYLRYTSLPTSEISEKTGFRNVNYFSMAFKKIVGCSPSEYRKQSWRQEDHEQNF